MWFLDAFGSSISNSCVFVSNMFQLQIQDEGYCHGYGQEQIDQVTCIVKPIGWCLLFFFVIQSVTIRSWTSSKQPSKSWQNVEKTMFSPGSRTLFLPDLPFFFVEATANHLFQKSPTSSTPITSNSSTIFGPDKMAAISAICHKTWRLKIRSCSRVTAYSGTLLSGMAFSNRSTNKKTFSNGVRWTVPVP